MFQMLLVAAYNIVIDARSRYASAQPPGRGSCRQLQAVMGQGGRQLVEPGLVGEELEHQAFDFVSELSRPVASIDELPCQGQKIGRLPVSGGAIASGGPGG